MKAKARYFIFTAGLIFAGILIGVILTARLDIFSTSQAQGVNLSKESIDILSRTDKAMDELTAATKPAVVNISFEQTVTAQPMQNPFFDDPFFRHFFGGPSDNQGGKPRKYKQRGLGSGVVVGREGYIITNNHVVQGADEIVVKLSDKRQFKGKVVGADPRTDLAVVRISAGKLPYLELGDSDNTKVGDRVIAIGNPFGLNQTVTSGIISAVGRADVGIADYEDFIQTDAAINPGNSGGALVSMKGELIGLNTAIFSTSGGYQGIGFAIPSNMIKVVMESLIKNGKVIRGWLGVGIQPLTPELARQFGLKSEKGVLVSEVTEGGPARKAGLQRGDVILQYGGKDLSSISEFRNMVAREKPGNRVTLKILRNGKEESVTVEIGELPSKLPAETGEMSTGFFGIHVQDISAQQKKMMGIPARINGVVIVGIEEDSPAGGVLQAGDIIREINRNKITNMNDFNAVVAKIKSKQDVLLLIYRNGTSLFITLSSQ